MTSAPPLATAAAKTALSGRSSAGAIARPRLESAPGGIPRPKLESAPGTATRPRLESAPGGIPRPKLESAPGTAPRPKLESAPGTAPRPKLESAPGTAPRPKLESAPGTAPRPKLESAPGTAPRPKLESSSGAPRARLESAPGSSPRAKLDSIEGTPFGPPVHLVPPRATPSAPSAAAQALLAPSPASAAQPEWQADGRADTTPLPPPRPRLDTAMGIGPDGSELAPDDLLAVDSGAEEPAPASIELDQTWARAFVGDDEPTMIIREDDPTRRALLDAVGPPSDQGARNIFDEPTRRVRLEELEAEAGISIRGLDLAGSRPTPVDPTSATLVEEWNRARRARIESDQNAGQAAAPAAAPIRTVQPQFSATATPTPTGGTAFTSHGELPSSYGGGSSAGSQRVVMLLLVVGIIAAIGVIVWALLSGGSEPAAKHDPEPPSSTRAASDSRPASATELAEASPVAPPQPPSAPTPTSGEASGALPGADAAPGSAAAAEPSSGPTPAAPAAAPSRPRATKPKPAPVPEPEAPATFDTAAARAAVARAAGSISYCPTRPGDPRGSATASVTFAPSGRVATVKVGAPFAGRPLGACIENRLRGASVAPFGGSAQTVSTRVTVR